MKKFILSLIAAVLFTVSANAMPYERARQQALFLADKMAYELNLTEEQYQAVYEINLDYLMSVVSVDDLYGVYWTRRNLDLSYILLDWQYRFYCDAYYFYRPLYWRAGYWHFGIYARYPHRHYLYFGRPYFWSSYRGGHSWHNNGGSSWYKNRTFTRQGESHFGMKDGYKRGDYKNGFNNNTRSTRSFGGTRSTETASTRSSNDRTISTKTTRGNSFGTRSLPKTTTRSGYSSQDVKTQRNVEGTTSSSSSRSTTSGLRPSSTRTTVTRSTSSYTPSTSTSSTSTPRSTFSPSTRSSSNTSTMRSYSTPSTSSRSSSSYSRPSTSSRSSFSSSRSSSRGTSVGHSSGGSRGGGFGSRR